MSPVQEFFFSGLAAAIVTVGVIVTVLWYVWTHGFNRW
jgi:hypothetical protein